jgi:hypothetical protein
MRIRGKKIELSAADVIMTLWYFMPVPVLPAVWRLHKYLIALIRDDYPTIQQTLTVKRKGPRPFVAELDGAMAILMNARMRFNFSPDYDPDYLAARTIPEIKKSINLLPRAIAEELRDAGHELFGRIVAEEPNIFEDVPHGAARGYRERERGKKVKKK